MWQYSNCLKRGSWQGLVSMGGVFQRVLDLIYGCEFPLHHYAFSSYLGGVQRDGEYICIDLQYLHAASLRDVEDLGKHQ